MSLKDKSLDQIIDFVNERLKSYSRKKSDIGEYIFNKNEKSELCNYIAKLNDDDFKTLFNRVSAKDVDFVPEYEIIAEICGPPSERTIANRIYYFKRKNK